MASGFLGGSVGPSFMAGPDVSIAATLGVPFRTRLGSPRGCGDKVIGRVDGKHGHTGRPGVRCLIFRARRYRGEPRDVSGGSAHRVDWSSG